ncbi:hypothetical protein DFQ28_001470 [Apophysomyces sp. BC1034]|nr:hypothetical protein DFQ30_001884 [Apophysomyces sp. BC1015]KAG0181227.1 hypothetical protein DFQ29_009017 [Apophysomyces sp. BC1021]KAG0190843.1 hypothetical protein DFQ28_001470 [Apophysomyces sp. BC1034]
MPIVVKSDHLSQPPPIAISDVVSKLVQIILRARVGSEHQCIQSHDHCCVAITDDAIPISWKTIGLSLVINIVLKDTETLLERWMMTSEPVNNLVGSKDTMDIILLLQAVYSYTRLMPVHGLLARNQLQKSDVCFVITLAEYASQQGYRCSSSKCDTVEFKPDAQLKVHRFQPANFEHLGRVQLDVVFDENTAGYTKDRASLSESHKSVVVTPDEAQIKETHTDLHEHFEDRLEISTKRKVNHSSILSWRMQHHEPAEALAVHPHHHHHHHHHQQPQQQHNSNHLHTHYNSQHHNSNATAIPIIAMRRLSRLSLSAMQQDEDEDEQTDHDSQTTDHIDRWIDNEMDTAHSYAMPIPSPRMQYTHYHGHGGLRAMAYSTSPSTLSVPRKQSTNHRRNSLVGGEHYGSLVGSYEESLLSGRMSTMPSKPITFHAQIGVLGYGDCKPSLKCPPHQSVVFPAFFYELKEDELPTPYVGSVDITQYRLPPRGQLQIVIKNPNKTAVKLFLVPYDVSDMPRSTKTFLRQKSYATHDAKDHLRYAIHIQICRTEKKRVYLYKHIRVVFANRIADSNERLKVVCEGPKEPVYIPLTTADLSFLKKP